MRQYKKLGLVGKYLVRKAEEKWSCLNPEQKKYIDEIKNGERRYTGAEYMKILNSLEKIKKDYISRDELIEED